MLPVDQNYPRRVIIGILLQTLDLTNKNEKHLDMIKEQRNKEMESNQFSK